MTNHVYDAHQEEEHLGLVLVAEASLVFVAAAVVLSDQQLGVRSYGRLDKCADAGTTTVDN